MISVDASHIVEEVFYTLLLQTYNSYGDDQRTIVNDTIQINVIDLCKIEQKDIDALADEIEPLQGASTLGTFTDTLSYVEIYELMVSQIGLD